MLAIILSKPIDNKKIGLFWFWHLKFGHQLIRLSISMVSNIDILPGWFWCPCAQSLVSYGFSAPFPPFLIGVNVRCWIRFGYAVGHVGIWNMNRPPNHRDRDTYRQCYGSNRCFFFFPIFYLLTGDYWQPVEYIYIFGLVVEAAGSVIRLHAFSGSVFELHDDSGLSGPVNQTSC